MALLDSALESVWAADVLLSTETKWFVGEEEILLHLRVIYEDTYALT